MAGLGPWRERDPRTHQVRLRLGDQHFRYCERAFIPSRHFALLTERFYQVYSNGLSEVLLGKAIKEFELPRDEIVVMTKV